MREPSRSRRRLFLLAGIVVVAGVGVALRGRIAQDASYHGFADQRTILGIPNFWNVASNLPFLLVGLAGFVALLSERGVRGTVPALRPAYAMFFVGTILVAFGSAYYHLAPSNETLVWDRLPMTVAFMSFFAVILGEHLGSRIGRRSLPFLLLLGASSVLYWRYTESRGNGDLRPYFVVQFLPLVLVPLILLLFPSPFTRPYFVWCVLLAYAVAKVLEAFDAPLYRALGVSGHTLKHFAAAAGLSCVVVAIRRREPRGMEAT
ncbi:MAG TPA: ceramidase domain-containing protein [Thermoanaerobaculia bacterium]|nr:ceramidase domain-containing protein [Thermoanaerobaculia bacterium]